MTIRTVEDNLENTLLVMHGYFASIYDENENIGDIFEREMKKKNITFEDFNSAYITISDYISKNYYENKDEIDKKYVAKVVDEMKRMVRHAQMIRGYQEMAEINSSISEEDMLAEISKDYNDGGKYNG
ncbi:MAG: hypothetical protein ABS939_10845 [Psychrobacillus sp.]